ncbi:hypothetical protein NIES4103_06260 [Nostoc sp. NIES-4103]|nr:hypothetical protein NIES4103_06260 [Nostoc sp. NIES-4103]
MRADDASKLILMADGAIGYVLSKYSGFHPSQVWANGKSNLYSKVRSC